MTRALVKIALFAALGLTLGLVFRWFYLDQLASTWTTINSGLGG